MIRLIGLAFALLVLLTPTFASAAGNSKRSLESGESITFVYGK